MKGIGKGFKGWISVLLVLGIFASFSVTALEPERPITGDGLPGWEDWWTTSSYLGENSFFTLYCPREGATVQDIFYYIGKLITENQGLLNQRYGESSYYSTSAHLMFTNPDFGKDPWQTADFLTRYFQEKIIVCNGTEIIVDLWNHTNIYRNNVELIEITLSSNPDPLSNNYVYNSDAGVYERTDIELYDTLEDIPEYDLFEERKGTWIQNDFMLFSSMYRLRDVNIVHSDYEIFDIEDFDVSLATQPNVMITNYSQRGGDYALVKRLSLTPVEAVVRDKVRELCGEARAKSDDVAKQLKVINDYFNKNVEYDHDYADWLTGSSRRLRLYYNEKSRLPNHAYGALIEGWAICSGYSHAIAEICNELDIPNFYIESNTHIWNMLYIDGKWKMLDVTWNATGWNPQNYFLVNDVADHDGDHRYDRDVVAARKKETLAYWSLKDQWDGWLEACGTHQKAIDGLVQDGIFRGDAKGSLNLHNGLTRAELAVLLTRLAGEEARVLENTDYYAGLLSFTDVPAWAKPYVGYCYEEGLLRGYTPDRFGAGDMVTVQMACTVLLRFSGVPETDWSYETSADKVREAGIMPEAWPTGTTALRNDIAMMIDAELHPVSAR